MKFTKLPKVIRFGTEFWFQYIPGCPLHEAIVASGIKRIDSPIRLEWQVFDNHSVKKEYRRFNCIPTKYKCTHFTTLLGIKCREL